MVLLLLAVLLFPAVFAACGGDDDGDESEPGSPDNGGQEGTALPSAYLRYEPGGFFELVPGTHCWDGDCVDMAGPLTQVDPLQLFVGEALAFSFEAGIPDDVTVSWFAAPAAAPAPEGGVRVWAGVAGERPLFTGTTAPTRTGRYVVVLDANWDGQGDISYAAFVDVTPPNTGS